MGVSDLGIMGRKPLLLFILTITLCVQTIHAEEICDKSVYDHYCENFERKYGELLSKASCEDYPEADKITILWENNFTQEGLVAGWYRETEHKIVRICNPNKEDVCVLPLRISAYYEYLDIDGLSDFKIYHNGRTVKLKESKNYRNYNVYFPSCAKGDIIEYQYRRYYQFPSVNSKGENLWSSRDYYFQDEDPIVMRALKVEFPLLSSLEYSAPDVDQPEKTLTNKNTYSWVMTDIEPYHYEAYAPPKREVIPRVSFSSISSWDDVDKWSSKLIKESNPPMLDKYATDFTLRQGYLSSLEDIMAEILSNKDESKTDEQVIYEWVRDNIKYASSDFWEHSFAPYKNEEILETRIGDCKDKATLLVTLLRKNGVKAHPVLVNTENRIDTNMPNPVAFDHMMVVIDNDGEYIWLDPTCDQCDFGYIPPDDQNKHVVILFSEDESLVITPEMDPEKNSLTEYDDIVTINADDSARFEETITYHGYESVIMRDLYSNADTKEKEDAIQEYIKRQCYSGFLEDYSFLNLNNKEMPTTIKINYTCYNYTSEIENYKSFGFPMWVINSVAIAKESRVYPLEFDYNWVIRQRYEVRLPPELKVIELPKNYYSSSEFADSTIEYDERDGKVFVTQALKLKKHRIEPDEYPTFKKFFENIVLSQDNIKLMKRSKSAAVDSIESPTGASPTGASGTKGICGPTVVILLATLPLVGGLLRRKNG